MDQEKVYMYREEYDKLIKQNEDMRKALGAITRSFVLCHDPDRLYLTVKEELDNLWEDHGSFWS
jgi:hypothetical protein